MGYWRLLVIRAELLRDSSGSLETSGRERAACKPITSNRAKKLCETVETGQQSVSSED